MSEEIDVNAFYTPPLEEVDVYIVRVKDPVTGKMLPVSAWVDPYHAKFEAARWEQDTKIPYDHVKGMILYEDVPYVP